MNANPPAVVVRSLGEWLAYIESIHAKPIDLGLDRTRAVFAALGTPVHGTVITVAGTNGKGSTCALLDAILRQAGYRVGLFTSPHLLHFNERLRLQGVAVDDAALIDAFERVEATRLAIGMSLTYFEFTTVAILDILFRAQLDVVVLEVGLGGRLDAVNIIDSDCAIVTSVDLDHMELLGPDRETIGREKAGIFRAGRPAIVSDPQPPTSIMAHAATVGADLWLIGRDFRHQGDTQQWSYTGRAQRRHALAYPALRGVNQLLNASAALAALEALADRLMVSAQAVRQGLALVEWPGRFQVLPGQPTIILDVAHNPHAAAHLRENLDNMGFHPATHAVFGMLADKDIDGVIDKIKGRIDHWHLVDTEGPRGSSAIGLRDALRRQGIAADSFDWAEHAKYRKTALIGKPSPTRSVQTYSSVAAAYRSATEGADTNDRIVVFGSFSVVAAALACCAKAV
ncbi:MAG: bifunctional tetrahydrofolate synthase/dihydrofolate synthase [Burkholderiaceae bacterium]